MNLAPFQLSIGDSITLLKELKLFKDKGVKQLFKDGVSDDFKKTSLSGNYLKTYQSAVHNLDYDILLVDDSLFQLEIDEGGARFAYFQSPLDYISYQDYILKNFEEYTEEYESHFMLEYEQFRSEQNINSSAITIRYDLDMPNYSPNIHAVSHYHIGNQNNVRIPCDKVINPLNFVLFTIKHVYYYEWKNAIENENAVLNEILNSSKQGCSAVNNTNWIDKEKREFFLT
ncbi:hypothetical protein ABID99_000175 [Mucilaginibacter sp. OAE612]|uniref:DUF2290 domain-containing protein n=1 Tax=Mucilaginibacter sp. OAE612 TaxID=3156444 RepID=UPI00359E2167